jgi:glycosyltransferase involved in cell wall biosynthesis
MRILIVSQYFWPEYFRINDLALDLSKSHDVEVLTGQPNYPSGIIFTDFKKNKKNYTYLEKIKIYRVPIFARRSGNKLLLTLNYLSFLISSIFYGSYLLRKKKYDVILTFATSPIIVALISIFLSKIKNTRHILWLLDLWPIVLHDLKIIEKNSYLYKIFNGLVNYIYKNSDLILCQSLSFKNEIKKISINKINEKLIYFPSWPEHIPNVTINNKSNFDKKFINILFTGNIGESQNFDLIIRLFQYLDEKKRKIRLYVAGEGRNFNHLKYLILNNNIKNIFLIGWMSFENLQKYFNEADFLLISLKYQSTFNKTIPGKFQTYLNYKKPILGLLGGETNKIINKYKIGKAFNYSNDENLFKDVDNYLTSKSELEYKNFDKLLNIFSRSKQIAKLNFYLEDFLNLSAPIRLNLLLKSDCINYDKKFIISALNLAFLGFFSKKDLQINNHFYFWPDGYFRKKFFPKDIKKIPGRELLKSLKIDKTFIKKIIVIGNLEEISKNYLKNIFDIEIKHIPLPYGNINDFKNCVPIFKKDEICFLTLPTPKQEILANYIHKNQNYCKIFCFGGAINMASGLEKNLPDKYSNILFAEAIWRLQFDTFRRTKRLIETFYYYLKGEINKDFNNFKVNIVNEKF